MAEAREFEIAWYGGTHKVRIGDVVTFASGESWTIDKPALRTIYSPAGLGGTPCFHCTPVGEMPSWARQFMEPDGSVVMCGDSIAGALAHEAKQHSSGEPCE